MNIVPIVEGQGEEAAVPELLRKLRNEAGLWNLEVGRPIRQRRTQLVKKATLQAAVRIAAVRADCTAILVLFDADDDCPKECAPTLEAWAREAAGDKPCAVVIANREYEAWFLAGMEALRGRCRIRQEAVSHPDPESVRGAKEKIEEQMPPGASYSPPVDQVRLTAHLDCERAYRNCRSFRKLVKAFGALAGAAGAVPAIWPPAAWVA